MAFRTIIFRNILRRNALLPFYGYRHRAVPQIFISKIKYSSKPNVSTIVNINKELDEKTLDIKAPNENKESKSSSGSLSSKYTFMFLGISATMIGSYLVFEFGKPEVDNNSIVIKDEFSDLPTWKEYLYRSLKQFDKFATLIKEPSREKLLPDSFKYPYYQPPYTLVIEFTDVLAHPDWTYKTGWRFKKRPGLDYLLENLIGLYEIVVFTAEPGITIFPVIEAVDPKNLISYKLVRDSTHFVDGHHVKNLNRLNRDLSKVIVVDWDAKSVKFHPENHLNVKKWDGDDDDTLIDLTSFLKTIAQTEIEDVRDVLRFYKQYDDPLKTFRKKQMEYLDIQKQNAEKEKQQRESKPRGFFNIFS